VILDAIVTSEDHGTSQADHFLGFYVQLPFCIGIGVQIEKALDDLVVFFQDPLVHLAAVFVEFFY
jgi:hypothetical protein